MSIQWTIALISGGVALSTWIASFIPMGERTGWSQAGNWVLRVTGLVALAIGIFAAVFHVEP